MAKDTNKKEDIKESKTEELSREELLEKIAELEREKAAAAEKADPEKNENYFNEPVVVNLFKDDDKYKDDVFVAVNGRTYQIKRGEDVTVPRNVALVLERSLAQDKHTINLIEAKEEEFRKKEKHLI